MSALETDESLALSSAVVGWTCDSDQHMTSSVAATPLIGRKDVGY